VTGDEVYGNDGALRRWLEGEQRSHGLAVACSHMVWSGGSQVRVAALVEQIPAAAWQRLEVGAGSKGPRVYDWACARLPYDTAPGWRQWLLLRRSITEPTELAFYRAFGPEATPVADLARVVGMRWTIEEGFQRAKAIGLDQYEVRRWEGWYRHITLCLLAHAFLEVTRAGEADGEKGGATAA
jgi:SRSO17 transposase